MAEIGLVRFARLALEVREAVLPPQRTKFSKRRFTQPQLLAVLCLMRYEDWTFREAEVRLSEHAELRSALRLNSVPDYTTLYRFLTRLREEDVARVLEEIVRRMPGRWRSPATVAVDATGLAQAAVSSYFIRRIEHFGDQRRSWRHWLKWLAVVDVERQIILAQSARQAPWNDCATLPVLVGQGTSAHLHRLRPGRCRIRLRTQPHLLPPTTESQQHHPRQTLHHPPRDRRARRNEGKLSPQPLWKTLLDRKRLLRHQTQTFLPRSRQNHRHSVPPGAAARPCLQLLPPLAAHASLSMSTEPNQL